MKTTAFLIAVALCTMVCARASEPTDVSPEELQRSDTLYVGKVVRVHGMIGPCGDASCPFCPSWEKMSWHCYPIARWKDYAASLAMNRLYSFTEVTVVGIIPDLDPNEDCFGLRGCSPGIADAEVERLHDRRAVTSLPADFRGNVVLPAGKAEQLQLREVFRASAHVRQLLDRQNIPMLAFAEQEADTTPTKIAPILHVSLCWGTFHGKSEVLPSRSGDLYWNSFANGYVCAHADKDRDRTWDVFDPDPAFE